MSSQKQAFAEWVLVYTCPVCGDTHKVKKEDGVFVICETEQFELILPENVDAVDYGEDDEHVVEFESDFEIN